VCTTAPAPGYAACDAIRRTDAHGKHGAGATAPAGLSPTDIRSAYNLTSDSTRTVAVVDAYDDPNAAADLAIYRSQYGLPACGTGCFTKLNQSGVAGNYPTASGAWAQEISLDLDMVSAACPSCHIVLVEANSNSLADLGAAVNTAASQPGVIAISNSYGGNDLSDGSYGAFYNHPGIAVTASTGDNGYGVQFPASSTYVTAVGGTSLKKVGNGWSESAWSGAGSGCSLLNNALTHQATFNTGCTKRAIADVAAVADPNTGVAIYDSYAYQGYQGWLVFGGTSAASPIIASVYALAGHGSGPDALYAGYASSNFHDVTNGSNSHHCKVTQWCNARPGWDGPTGLGTPKGIGGF
jgi:subtilase family serine protease